MRISEVEDIFKEFFSEESGLVKTLDTVYETPSSGDYRKLVITIHGLVTDDTTIIHTKFIFKVDKNKTKLVENSFMYLYDINCVYHNIEFENGIDLKSKLGDIIDRKDFGTDLQILSDFIEAPSMFLNYYMRRHKITDYSIFDVEYQPKFKTSPCENTTFDFKININNEYDFELSIRKFYDDDEEMNIYKFQFRFMDEIETYDSDTLNNVHYFIGSNIAKMLDKKLKNK
jgi:hypothetical protein